MRFNGGYLNKDVLIEIRNDKVTSAMRILKKLIDMYGEEEIQMHMIGNESLEVLLVELAELTTKQLKISNEGVKQYIVKSIKDLN